MAEEDVFLERAVQLTDLDDLRDAVRELIGGMEQAGADPASVTSLIGAHSALGGGAVAYNPGSRKDRHAGGGYGSDGEFLDALHDVTEQVSDHAREAGQLDDWFARAAEKLDAAQARAIRDVAAAYALPVKDECDGCHGFRQAAINRAETILDDINRRIRVTGDALDILEELRAQLDQALALLKQVPHDLGEVYELVFAFVARGGKMPVHGRWVEGGGQ